MPLLQKLRTSEFLASLAQIWLCLNIASVHSQVTKAVHVYRHFLE